MLTALITSNVVWFISSVLLAFTIWKRKRENQIAADSATTKYNRLNKKADDIICKMLILSGAALSEEATRWSTCARNVHVGNIAKDGNTWSFSLRLAQDHSVHFDLTITSKQSTNNYEYRVWPNTNGVDTMIGYINATELDWPDAFQSMIRSLRFDTTVEFNTEEPPEQAESPQKQAETREEAKDRFSTISESQS